MNFRPPKIYSSSTFPSPQKLKASQSLVIFDQWLLKNGHFKKWIAQFPNQYGVQSGEQLKQAKNFPKHIEKILRIATEIEKRPLQIIAIGGGSVGDFAGFIASILYRGVDLVQIPSTWLAAVDSAHGGKTALNADGFKNQIGSFHQAKQIYLIDQLLKSQPKERLEEALGEALKISLLHGGELWKQFSKLSSWNHQNCWKLLPRMIAAKYAVVRKDPFEKTGLRHILNLGHTLGHIFESQLGVAHGRAVLLGLDFALHWSFDRGVLGSTEMQKLIQSPILRSVLQSEDVYRALKKIRNPQQALKSDKKRAQSGKVRFIFLAGAGKPKVEEVSVDEIVSEIKRQS